MILSSTDDISIPTIFKNLCGKNISGNDYQNYLKTVCQDIGVTTVSYTHLELSGLQVIAVVPYRGQSERWNDAMKARYDTIRCSLTISIKRTTLGFAVIPGNKRRTLKNHIVVAVTPLPFM